MPDRSQDLELLRTRDRLSCRTLYVFCSSQLCNRRQMDLSGPSIDVKLKEKKERKVSSRDFPQPRVSIRVPHCRKIFRSRFSFPLLYFLFPVPPPPLSPFSYFWLFSILFYSVFLSVFSSLSSTDGGRSRGSASSQDFCFW